MSSPEASSPGGLPRLQQGQYSPVHFSTSDEVISLVTSSPSQEDESYYSASSKLLTNFHSPAPHDNTLVPSRNQEDLTSEQETTLLPSVSPQREYSVAHVSPVGTFGGMRKEAAEAVVTSTPGEHNAPKPTTDTFSISSEQKPVVPRICIVPPSPSETSPICMLPSSPKDSAPVCVVPPNASQASSLSGITSTGSTTHVEDFWYTSLQELTVNSTTSHLHDIIDYNEGLKISFESISYNVIQQPKRCGRKETPKCVKVLHKINGIFVPGINAIMGPSGSGKSTLTKILSGRLTSEGTVLVNGFPVCKALSKQIGYCPQEDLLNESLSAREQLWYALRLKSSNGKEEDVKEKLEELLKDLGLEKCADTRIGDLSNSLISGGERKRISIGMELASYPKVMFLDEPTTGLDSSSARRLVVLLKRFAEEGRTIVMTIHQPSGTIYKLFDTLTLIGLGQMIYHGPAEEALSYFDRLGYSLPRYYSPPDFFLDILFGLVSPTIPEPAPNAITTRARVNSGGRPARRTRVSSLRRSIFQRNFSDGNNNASRMRSMSGEGNRSELSNDSVFETNTNSRNLSSSGSLYESKLDRTTAEGAQEHRGIVRRLAAAYEKSAYAGRVRTKLRITVGQSTLCGYLFYQALDPAYNYGFWDEFSILVQRCMKGSYRLFCKVFVLNLMLSILFGVFFFQNYGGREMAVKDRLGFFFYLSVFGTAIPSVLAAEDFFQNDKALYRHESKGYQYRCLPFFLGKCVPLAGIRLISSMAVSLIVYWMTACRASFGAFFFFLVTCFMIGFCFDSFALLCSIAFERVENIKMVINAHTMLCTIFTGFILNTKDALWWIKWIRFFSVTRYGYIAWTLNEFPGNTSVPCHSRIDKVASEVTEKCVYYPKDTVLKHTIGGDTVFLDHPWLCNFFILVETSFFLMLAFIKLKLLQPRASCYR